MGLLDDIKKLRKRAESLNNNIANKNKSPLDLTGNKTELFKTPKVIPSKAAAQEETIFTEKTSIEENQQANKRKPSNNNLKSEPTEDKPRVDDKLQAFRLKAKEKKHRQQQKKRESFFKKPYKSLHEQSKERDVKENFYESLNIKILIIIVSVLLIFTLLKVDISFKNNKQVSSQAKNQVPNDNKANYLDKSLIVCTGSFETIEEAKIARKRLRKITEQESKIIKIADYYSIQIGGHYFSKDDAFYILSELSASGIKDISLRLE